MNGLEIIDLYDKYDDKKINSFCDNIDSNLRVVTNSDSVDCNFEWLEIMEDTIQYLDNILRNPNRFIVNEEDIVKIDKHIVRIHVIKTQERKITSGFARAEVIKRVYGKPVKFNNFDYDLTKYIVKKTLSE